VIPAQPITATGAEQLLAAYDYALPADRIAKYPTDKRDGARLLAVQRRSLRDHAIVDLPKLLQAGDLLVGNDTRVLPARCVLQRSSGARIELLLLRGSGAYDQALVKRSRRLRPGEVLRGPGAVALELGDYLGNGRWRVSARPTAMGLMAAVGQIPLPPYLGRPAETMDSERYQTTFAKSPGAVAAPTAGLHLTQSLRSRLDDRGVGWSTITLHVGEGTFRPLQAADVDRGTLHEEAYSVPEETVEAIRATRTAGGRVIALGTTTTRALESATAPDATVPASGAGLTQLFIQEGYRFRCVDGLVTNFHLPRSSLLFLVSAFLGRARLQEAYAHAIEHNYRFYSYGDAMLVL
jgi:S-adenosylmethionine:tRNA ribosyltransferase-isomerase